MDAPTTETGHELVTTWNEFSPSETVQFSGYAEIPVRSSFGEIPMNILSPTFKNVRNWVTNSSFFQWGWTILDGFLFEVKFFNVSCNAITRSPKFGEITVSIDLRRKLEFGYNSFIAYFLSRRVEWRIVHLKDQIEKKKYLSNLRLYYYL